MEDAIDFVENEVETSNFDLGDVDPRALALAHHVLRLPGAGVQQDQ